METKTFVKIHWRWVVCAVLFLLNLVVWVAAIREDRHGVLTFSMLDVGQGDALLIDSPTGNQMLVDGGPPGHLIAPLSKALPFYDRSIDLIALSHPHLDHFGGLIDLLERYEVGGIITSGTKNPGADYDTFLSSEKEAGLEEIVVQAGQRIVLGGGAHVDVLLPQADVSDATPHNGMLVMRLVYGSTSVMLTGDMESNIEDFLARRDGAALKSDVLKAGHHGSKTSSSEVFLEAVDPRAALVSVGGDNKYGHPNDETLQRLERFKTDIYRTDERGTVTFISDGKKIRFED